LELEIKPGARFRSAVCTTEIAVVKGSGASVDLRCGGHPVVPMGTEPPADLAIEAGFDGGTAVGKRLVDDDDTIEVLCTKAGAGSLSIADALLRLKEAKPLPSSD
jgi:hypothetical protein